MAVDSVVVSSNTGVDGNSYTSSISNDELTNDDFLTLMITELKLQDPTSTMDSSEMLSTQMQMSTINTNQETIATMQSLQETFSLNTLSSAANVIGKNIEDGEVGDNGVTKAYTVRSVENYDGQVVVKAQQILYMENAVKLVDADDNTSFSLINYNVNGEIIDEDGNVTGQKITLENPGSPLLRDGELVILDENFEEITDHNYKLYGASAAVYSDELESIPFSSIAKIF